MRLLAISDLHIGAKPNLQALDALAAHPDDWLIVAGDIGETFEHLTIAFGCLTRRFARVIWVPGNHELWCLSRDGGTPRGDARYRAMVELARNFGVLTPEDPYPTWDGPGGPIVLAPLFLLYDYTFRPPHVARDEVIAWAAEHRIRPADELYLDPVPFASRSAWCRARVEGTEARLAAIDPALPTVLINHFPLRERLARLPRIPRFTPWCGTRLTDDWPARFRARACVYGHLHIRGTKTLDGTAHHEVSLGYPAQWDQAKGIAPYIRQILPTL